MSKDVSAALLSHIAGEVTTLCTCWKLQRTDGRIFTFTDHDEALVFEGFEYKPSAGYKRTAVSTDASLNVDNLDVTGVLDDASITENDLKNGMFDWATVEMFIVNYVTLTQGKIKVRKGKFGEVVTLPDGTFKAELRGLSQQLAQSFVEVYGPTCRTDLGSTKCKIPINPDLWQPETSYSVGQFVRGQIEAWTPMGLLNGSFETDVALNGPNQSVTDWTSPAGQGWRIHDNFAAAEGDNFVIGGTSVVSGDGFEYLLEQTVDVSSFDADIDDGNIKVRLTVAARGFALVDPGKIEILFLDEDNEVISQRQIDYFIGTADWIDHVIEDWAPTNCRAIHIRLWNRRDDSPIPDGCAFDNVRLDYIDMTAADPWGGVIFKATTAGVSDTTEPTWDTDLGDTTADGSVVWTAITSFTKQDVVATVASRLQFTATTLANADDYWNGGFVQWVSGDNRGRSMEIKDWTLSGKIVQLYLPMAKTIKVGDVFRIAPGCDKTRATCRDRFANMINFRGEPDLPGQDQMMDYPVQ